MNKTVNINLSGIIFHIEEDAYGKLHNYLATIKGYFSESEGRDEIMADIENRIAEMLSEKISDRKQVVLMTDVDRVIEIMGKPEDFLGEQTQGEATKKEQPIYSTSGKRRRVFRDPDNKILGGVCSGIANYFNIDPLWLRLALVVSFFAFGTGFLLYIVLWIVIPEAKTAGEKLEMRGEEVNFSNIGKKVEEEIHSFGKKAENWGEEVKQNVHAKKAGNFVQRFFDFIASVFGAFFRVFAKLLGVVFIIIGLIFLSIILLYCGMGITLLYIAVILFFGVPLIMLVYWGVKMLLGIKKGNKIVNFSAGILWIIGLALMITRGIQGVGHLSEQATSKQEITLTKTKCDTLFLRVKEINGWNSRDNFYKRYPLFRHWDFRYDSVNVNFGYPKLDIVKSESDSMEIVVYKEARGKDRKEALRNARNINYEICQKDSLIELMPYCSILKEEKWRLQRVHVEVRLPKGKTVYLSKSMKNILHNIKNETDTWDGDMVGRRWIMGKEELRCVDCEGLTGNTSPKNKKEKIMIGPDGINIESAEERIKIDSEGIHIEDADDSIEISKDGIRRNTKATN